MTEAQDDAASVGTDGVSVGAQVLVVLPGRDRGEADVGGVDLHEWQCAMLGRLGSEAGLEGLRPSAVVGDQAWADPRGPREGSYPA